MGLESRGTLGIKGGKLERKGEIDCYGESRGWFSRLGRDFTSETGECGQKTVQTYGHK